MADEAAEEYKTVFGVRLQVPCDMPDNILKHSINVCKTQLATITDWHSQGDSIVETIKADLDKNFGEHWHVVMGKHFGSKVTHQAKMFAFFCEYYCYYYKPLKRHYFVRMEIK